MLELDELADVVGQRRQTVAAHVEHPEVGQLGDGRRQPGQLVGGTFQRPQARQVTDAVRQRPVVIERSAVVTSVVLTGVAW